ncbi:MAG: hypothetical protein K5696_12125 [Lachnospiraceae bacterium]|nr:hypothetical protein [Lachnospiraceae bacterium]
MSDWKKGMSLAASLFVMTGIFAAGGLIGTAAETPLAEAEERTGAESEGDAVITDDQGEYHWEWDERINEAGTDIIEVTAKVRYQGTDVDAVVTQGELVRAANCEWPAQYEFTAVAQVDGKEVKDVQTRGFGHIPDGHDLKISWELNKEDVAWPFYEPKYAETCAVCGQKVNVINDRVDTISGGDVSCVCDTPVSYEFSYQLRHDDGSESRPFRALSGNLILPATGVHVFMRNNDEPWWDWQPVEGEDNRWTASIHFWCGNPHNDEVVYTEEAPEVTVTSREENGMTTWTAVYEGNFYNATTGKLDRKVKFSSVRISTKNGLDIMGVRDRYYTGSAVIQEELEVFSGEHRLSEGTEYTVRYKNNRNAGDALLTITGTGKYKGSVTIPFRIIPLDFGMDFFEARDVFAVNNGKSQKKKSPLLMDGKKVAASAYTYEFADDCRTEGEHLVTIKAKAGKTANFTGSRKYRIFVSGANDKSLVSASQLKVNIKDEYKKFNLSDWFNYEAFLVRWDGDKKILPAAFTLTWKNKDVTSALDWTQVDVREWSGTATLNASFSDETVNGVRIFGALTFDFALTTPDIGSCQITIPSEIPYPGRTIDPSVLEEEGWLKIVDPKGRVYDENGQVIEGQVMELRRGDNYTVAVKNGAKAGNMKVTVTGARGYSGSKTFTVKITKPDLKDLFVGRTTYDPEKDTDVFLPVENENISYAKGGAVIPDLRVGRKKNKRDEDGRPIEDSFYLEDLLSGRDYTLQYKNNAKSGNQATLTVKGKGNYTGTWIIPFKVVDRQIENTEEYYSELCVLTQDVTAPKNAAKTMKPYMARVEIYDRITGKKLQEKKDYTLEYYYWNSEGPTKFDASTPTAGIGGLSEPGTGFEVRILAKAGSGFAGTQGDGYRLVTKTVKPSDFKIKDQVLPLDRWGNLRNDYYFIHPDEMRDPDNRRFDPWQADDAYFKQWADAYFSAYPSGSRFRIEQITGGEKAGRATAVIRVIYPETEGKEPSFSIGGYVSVKFNVANKDLVKN